MSFFFLYVAQNQKTMETFLNIHFPNAPKQEFFFFFGKTDTSPHVIKMLILCQRARLHFYISKIFAK